MNSATTHYRLPDLLTLCDFKGDVNPHYEKAGAESSAWIVNFNLFPGKKQVYFKRSGFELLTAHAYPEGGYEQFRMCCDYLNMIFAFDEVTDDLNGKDAKAVAATVLKCLSDTPNDEAGPISQMAKEFWSSYRRFGGPRSSRRFVEHFKNYLDAVTSEAINRERGEILDLESYVILRRGNSGIHISLDLLEGAIGIDLPDEVFANTAFLQAYWAVADMIAWANDLYSYNFEQAKGHSANNVITVLIKSKGMSLQDACDYVGDHFGGLMKIYHSARADLPSWGPEIDTDVARFLEAGGRMARGYIDWSFETERYFGELRQQVKETRTVTLRPSGAPEDYMFDELKALHWEEETM